ncbi:MAG: DUF192 domain-containing protein [Actinomycetota bacterium]|nr:DUF192 domain-containing protein [Actinomycetota bacterium]
MPPYEGMKSGLESFPVARGFGARFRGLSHRDRAGAGPGLLIPRCASVHTFGMRFPLDLYFLDGEGRVLCVKRGVPPRRVVWCPGARKVLEIPSSQGESRPPSGLRRPCCPKEKR